MENFIVSARKYRPATFESVVGQQHITSTLRNAISRGQLAHAYLFCGPRGVGKTTCARIFAKAINCLSPQSSEACNECESCRSFNEGRSFNIHELDAASNNSVDDIRSLTDQVRIPPQVGRYSVYIIDEVHMLSSQAFNAFLKTLEEPPAHAVFILATTEKHKIIPTILSRCQIYDFNRIRVEDGVSYLKYIAGQENVTFDDESLHLISQKADGGMRDALSMFDKAVSFCGHTLNFREVAQTLNVLDYDTYFNITDSVMAGDYPAVLTLFDGVLRGGFSGQTFITGLNSHFRDLLMCRDTQTMPLLEATGTLRQRYQEQASVCDTPFLFESIALLTSLDGTLRTATNQRLNIELGLMKLCAMGQKKNSGPNKSLISDMAGGTSTVDLSKMTVEKVHVPAAKAKAAEAVEPAPAGPVLAESSGSGVNQAVAVSPAVSGSTVAKGQHDATASDSHTTATAPVNSDDTSAQPVPDVSRPPSPPETGAASTAPQRPSSPVTPLNGNGRKSLLAGTSITELMNRPSATFEEGGPQEGSKDNSSGVSATSEAINPDEAARRIEAGKAAFIKRIEVERPRIAMVFASMVVQGPKVHLVVPTEDLKEEILRIRTEILTMISEESGVTAGLDMVIVVKENKTAIKPIKVEDKVKHLAAKNPLLIQLKKRLDLELE